MLNKQPGIIIVVQFVKWAHENNNECQGIGSSFKFLKRP